MGWTLVSQILAGALIGWGLDYLFKTKPTILIIGIIAGVAIGMLNFIRSAVRAGREATANAPKLPRQDLAAEERTLQTTDPADDWDGTHS
jgi:F0F1-type ATP synthase assembly protein I